MIEVNKGGDALTLNKSGNRRGFNEKGNVGRKKKEPTTVLSIRMPVSWLNAFGGDEKAAAAYAKAALEAMVKRGAICP